MTTGGLGPIWVSYLGLSWYERTFTSVEELDWFPLSSNLVSSGSYRSAKMGVAVCSPLAIVQHILAAFPTRQWRQHHRYSGDLTRENNRALYTEGQHRHVFQRYLMVQTTPVTTFWVGITLVTAITESTATSVHCHHKGKD